MAKYIRFTVTPTDGSPYTQWLNADIVYRSLSVNYDEGTGPAPAKYLMGSASGDRQTPYTPTPGPTTGSVYAVPTSSETSKQIEASARIWWDKALDKLESQASQVMFIDADGSPASGITGLSSTPPDAATPPPATKG